MIKGLLANFATRTIHSVHGEKYTTILRYFFPECVTSFLLYSMPFLLDAYFIGHLKSTPSYGTLGATNNFIHFIIKTAEALSVGTIIVTGKYNGRENFLQVGRTLRDSFWLTCILGGGITALLWLGAPLIYGWYVPAELVALGVPFLRLRALSIFLMFVFLTFVGFLRGIKNTQTPMHIFMVGTAFFLFFDYVLIFGKFGFPDMGLQGSALASVIQYAIMVTLIMGYVLYEPTHKKYGIKLMSLFSNLSQCKELLVLSWPILIDKATMALAYLWLCAMMKPLGSVGVATFSAIKDMERFALVPAIAFAQVITLLASNDLGSGNWPGIKANLKKVLLLSISMVLTVLFILMWQVKNIVYWFDRQGEFSPLVIKVFPLLGILVIFDVLQLILSGALRGVANVRYVMWVRLIVCAGYFVPVSYLLSQLPMKDVALKLMLVYGSFYAGHAFMCMMYIRWFVQQRWNNSSAT